MNHGKIRRILEQARAQGRTALLESEGLALLDSLDIPSPEHQFVRDAAEAARVQIPGDRVVVKVVSPEILHKSDVGGIQIVANDSAAVREAVERMAQHLAGRQVAGYTINRFLEYDRALGGELLVGLRYTDDFGPIVTLGPGGVYTEYLASKLAGATLILSPRVTRGAALRDALATSALTPLLTGQLRGQKARVELPVLAGVIERLADVAESYCPELVADLEINPLVIDESGTPVALDILVKLGSGARVPGEGKAPARPLHKIRNVLEPRSAAILGVSERMNPGRVILRNMIREGFDRERLSVVKPGASEIDGCRCYPDVESLPEKVDLAVLSISAAQVPVALTEFIRHERAEGIIVIPGGMGEKAGSAAIVEEITAKLHGSRKTPWGGPVINGGNCLGIRSRPGRYDTLFIPGYKLPVPTGPVHPVAVISQSGAYAIARLSKLGWINPRYTITLGNQMDLTVGDYLSYLADDPHIDLFAVYVEGFRPGDGQAFVEASRKIIASGRSVILYRSGRTAAGAKASASHTASIAGDYEVTRQLARAAGVVMAETIGDFEALVALFTLLRERRPDGVRLGAVSNAGFECVACADNIGEFHLPAFAPTTATRIEAIFRETRLGGIVDVHNPLDVTPMMPDAEFAECARAVLEDEGVDVAVVGCVPLTPALHTLPPADEHKEDLHRAGALVDRLGRLFAATTKPWVAVIDSGRLYDPMVDRLAQAGIPVFRSADRALRLLNVFCSARRRPQVNQPREHQVAAQLT